MSNVSKKMLMAAAGSAGGAGLDVDEVFSTFLYKGTGSAQTITNNIDLTEGGLVWIKNRDYAFDHALIDTARGTSKYLNSASTGGSNNISGFTSFNNNGFTISTNEDKFNYSSAGYNDYVSWTFRNSPKFFQCVSWTGDGTTGRSISHSLDSPVGMIIAKKTSGASQWSVLHRSVTISGSPAEGLGRLNLTNRFNAYSSGFNEEFPSSTAFKVSHVSGASSQTLNTSGEEYVAYLFAHNNNDGEFGPSADQDIIKCGSYTGNGSSLNSVSLGFEPQWVMIKRTNSSASWYIFDVMRGMAMGDADFGLIANSTDAEMGSQNWINPTATGFDLTNSNANVNGTGDTYIFMAIRRGSLFPPEAGDATKVFAMDAADGSSNNPTYVSGFPVDMGLYKRRTGTPSWRISSRLTQGEYMETSSTVAQQANQYHVYDFQNGYFSYAENSNHQAWMWKRAPSYFDVCAWTGTGSARTVSHNLGVAPEMIWTKRRSDLSNWMVYHSALGNTKALYLDSTTTPNTSANWWNNTSPTSSVFTVGTDSWVNYSGSTYIAYLFATVAGVSKVGSVSHTNGTDTNVSCGFSSGARFILIKRTDGASSWYVFDTVRGIVAGDDKGLYLQSNLAEQTGDWIDPFSSGFTMVGASFDTGSYIFYAIA